MPRKAKARSAYEIKDAEPIDIVEIDYDNFQPSFAREQSHFEQQHAYANGVEPQQPQPANPKPISQKRLEALAKGREKARLNRLKKKEDEKNLLKEQLKKELSQQEQPTRDQLRWTEGARLKEKEVIREPSPEKKKIQPIKEVSESEEEQEVQKKEKKKKQKEPPKQPPKQSKAEEQKKVLQKAKKNIPVFKEESRPKRQVRVKDFFKPKKVIEVSDSEESDSEAD